MKDHLISLFIDNELDLEEKIEFVEIVHNDTSFKDETVELLIQEKFLRTEMVAKRYPVYLQRFALLAGKRSALPAGDHFWLAGVMAMLLAAALFLTRSGPELVRRWHNVLSSFGPKPKAWPSWGPSPTGPLCRWKNRVERLLGHYSPPETR